MICKIYIDIVYGILILYNVGTLILIKDAKY